MIQLHQTVLIKTIGVTYLTEKITCTINFAKFLHLKDHISNEQKKNKQKYFFKTSPDWEQYH